jgi:AbiV family abortive infection protein
VNPNRTKKGQIISRQKYHELSEASFENAKELMEESELLLNNDRYARSYALAVLSLEEFAKSLMWKEYNLKCQRYKHEALEFPKTYGKLITQHKIKQSLFLSSLVFRRLMKEMIDQKVHGQPTKEGINRKVLELDSLLSKIANLEIDKQNAFYVNIHQGKISVPKDSVNRENCDVLVKVLRESVDPFKQIVGLDMSSEMGQFVLKAWVEMDKPHHHPK